MIACRFRLPRLRRPVSYDSDPLWYAVLVVLAGGELRDGERPGRR